MTLRVRELDDAAAPAWDDFVDRCPEATFFHKAGWRAVVEESFGQPAYFRYVERDGVVCGVLPLVYVRSALFGKRLVSNAFCVAGGPAAEDAEARAALNREAESLFRSLGAEFIEYRDARHVDDGWVEQADLYAAFEREMSADADDNLKQIPRKQRAVVRKALSSDLVDEIDEDVERLYGLYSLNVRNHGTPVFAKRYFESLRRTFGSQCEVLTVVSDGKPLSSVLSFYFRDRVMPYYTGGVAEARRLGANDLMYWRVMRRAVECGYRVFDFGRSKEGTGAYSFKKNWGFEPRSVRNAFYLRPGMDVPNINPLNPKYRLFIGLWQRLPLPLANLIGPRLARQLG